MASHLPRSSNHEIAHSAGGVCYRVADGNVYVVLIATNGRTRWGLPKGHVGTGEQPVDAACREVFEETGVEGTALHLIETIEYWFRARRGRVHKYVDFYLLRYEEGEILPQETEVDDARWFSIDEAVAIAAFPRERAVLEHVRELWRRGQLP
ncbi:MAG TPA: NUDIX hydrolase [Herpetosiphonaceae bacterium]|jgi:8-oxo-dGTP pyrophosphatase MutT (NUDIX family)|nr:NUDIX hydrolase [Herpetosiphonaceae bacterium]